MYWSNNRILVLIRNYGSVQDKTLIKRLRVSVESFNAMVGMFGLSKEERVKPVGNTYKGVPFSAILEGKKHIKRINGFIMEYNGRNWKQIGTY